MGLFGGFKAKFSKDSVAKSDSKSSKNKEVVCLGYRAYSEFADPPQYLNPPSAERKPLSGIKTVPPRVQPQLASVSSVPPPVQPQLASVSSVNPRVQPQLASVSSVPTENAIVTNPKVKKPPKKKASQPVISVNKVSNGVITPPSIEITPSTPPVQEEKTFTSSTPVQVKVSKPQRQTKVNKIEAHDASYVLGKTSSFNPISTKQDDREHEIPKPPPRSILKANSATELRESSSIISSDHVDSRSTLSESKSINSVQYLSTNQPGSTVGTKPLNNAGYAQKSRGIGNTSSFAANLFFADDDDDDGPEQKRSSAEC